jgi:hypothetical protein
MCKKLLCISVLMAFTSIAQAASDLGEFDAGWTSGDRIVDNLHYKTWHGWGDINDPVPSPIIISDGYIGKAMGFQNGDGGASKIIDPNEIVNGVFTFQSFFIGSENSRIKYTIGDDSLYDTSKFLNGLGIEIRPQGGATEFVSLVSMHGVNPKVDNWDWNRTLDTDIPLANTWYEIEFVVDLTNDSAAVHWRPADVGQGPGTWSDTYNFGEVSSTGKVLNFNTLSAVGAAAFVDSAKIDSIPEPANVVLLCAGAWALIRKKV